MNNLNDQTIKTTMQAYVDGITQSNIEGIMALFADDAVIEDPVGSSPVKGKAALRKFYQTACEIVERMELEGSVRVREKWGACAMLAYTTGAEGSVVETLDVMEFDSQGKIVTMKAYWGESNLRSM